jgi:serine phosphatase RsbU (regulator of sigma subunit)
VRANDDLYEELDRQNFVTAAVVILDPARRGLSVLRAGHVPPLLVRKGSPPAVERLDSSGPALGLFPGEAFRRDLECRSVALAAGDVLFLHTDGLEDACNGAGEDFGSDRLAAVLRAHAHLEAALLLGAVALEVEQFGGPEDPQDDITALCVRVL